MINHAAPFVALLASLSMHHALVSWFDDGAEQTACGTHLHDGYAHLPGRGWPCAARVRFCHWGRCVVGRREDSGPYVPGRAFDLTPSLRSDLACPDLCWVVWERAR